MSSSLGINDSNNSVKDNRSIVSDSLTIKSYDNHAGNTEKVSTTSHESATSLISMLSPSKLSPSKWFQGKNTISNDSSIVDENLSSEQDDLSLISELRLQVDELKSLKEQRESRIATLEDEIDTLTSELQVYK